MEIIRRRAKRKGGRPKKSEAHRHTEVARLTPAEHAVFLRDAEALRIESPTDLIRKLVHERAIALGVELSAEYLAVRSVREMNAEGRGP